MSVAYNIGCYCIYTIKLSHLKIHDLYYISVVHIPYFWMIRRHFSSDALASSCLESCLSTCIFKKKWKSLGAFTRSEIVAGLPNWNPCPLLHWLGVFYTSTFHDNIINIFRWLFYSTNILSFYIWKLKL